MSTFEGNRGTKQNWTTGNIVNLLPNFKEKRGGGKQSFLGEQWIRYPWEGLINGFTSLECQQ